MKNKKPSDIFPKETEIFFRSGNFIGLYGKVKNVENDSKDAKAIYGFKIEIELENGKTAIAYKSEHLQKI